jgi:hypothetical protein
MGLASDWNKSLADAKKILGNSAKIPVDTMSVVQKNMDDANKFCPEITTMREALEKKVLAWQNAVKKIGTSLDAAEDHICGCGYKLDPKKPDDKKKMDQADALFTEFFKSHEKRGVDYENAVADIVKHVIRMIRPDPRA